MQETMDYIRPTIYSNHKPERIVSKAHCEGCYCRESPEEPSLKIKQSATRCNAHPSEENINTTASGNYCCDLLKEKLTTTAGHSEQLLEKAHRTVSYTPKSVFLRRLKEQSHKTCDLECMGANDFVYTARRADYEWKAPFYEQDYAATRLIGYENQRPKGAKTSNESSGLMLENRPICGGKMQRGVEESGDGESLDDAPIEHQDNRDEEHIKDRGESDDDGKADAAKPNKSSSDHSLATKHHEMQPDAHCNCCKCQTLFATTTTMSAKDFSGVRSFRDRNYFDTHSLADLMSSKDQSHVCVHKFVLNDRLLPEPSNPDAYGVSRCTICQKPMNSDSKFKTSQKIPESKTTMKSAKLNSGQVVGGGNNDNKDTCLIARQLNTGAGNEQIHLQVPFEMIQKSAGQSEVAGYVRTKLRRPVPTNSLALRFQKGVV